MQKGPIFIVPPDPGATACKQWGPIFILSPNQGQHMQAEGANFSALL